MTDLHFAWALILGSVATIVFILSWIVACLVCDRK
jgi:hypothetical protein